MLSNYLANLTLNRSQTGGAENIRQNSEQVAEIAQKVNAVENNAKDMRARVTESANSAADKFNGILQNGQEFALQTKESLEKGIKSAVNTAQTGMETVTDAAQTGMETVTDAAQTGLETVKDTVSDVVEMGSDTATTASNSVMSNTPLQAVVVILSIVYCGLLINVLPGSLVGIFNNFYVKIALMMLVAYLATRHIPTAVMVGLCFVLTLQLVERQKLFNTSNDSSTNDASISDAFTNDTLSGNILDKDFNYLDAQGSSMNGGGVFTLPVVEPVDHKSSQPHPHESIVDIEQQYLNATNRLRGSHDGVHDGSADAENDTDDATDDATDNINVEASCDHGYDAGTKMVQSF